MLFYISDVSTQNTCFYVMKNKSNNIGENGISYCLTQHSPGRQEGCVTDFMFRRGCAELEAGGWLKTGMEWKEDGAPHPSEPGPRTHPCPTARGLLTSDSRSLIQPVIHSPRNWFTSAVPGPGALKPRGAPASVGPQSSGPPPLRAWGAF